MAKYRHRLFEMYDFRDEATCALMPKSDQPAKEASAPETWKFEHLVVSRSAGVTHVTFKGAEVFGEDTLRELREDFAQLADRLARDSKVVLDFAGVRSFSPASHDALALFYRRLQTKGSRMALCCLDAAARESFFVTRSP